MSATETQAPAATGAVANASLYVGDLDREVTEAQLFELFSQAGPVASIRVCRDSITRRSLGYAYVNYNSSLDPNAAQRALETLNYTQVNGKPLRIMWSNRDPALRKSNTGNIFIKNLDKSIDHKALYDTFIAFGNILSAKVAMDANGVSKGYGFVQYDTEDGALKAIEQVNGMLLEGKQVYVGQFQPRTDRSGGEVKFTNVYIKNLPEEYDEAKLTTICEEYGTINSCVIMMDEEGKSKGFGFVNFADPDEAAKAVDALNGKEFEGKELYVGRAQKKSEREQELKNKFEELRNEKIAKYQGMNLYVKNLADDVDDEKLRAEFAPFGTITSARVMRDPTNGRSKGFGFVCYSLPEEATKAVTEMNQKMLDGKPIYVAMAQRKEVRKQQLDQLYQQRMPAMGMGGGPGRVAGPMSVYGAPPPMYYQGPGGMPPQRSAMPGMYPPVGPMAGRGPSAGRGPRNMVMQQGPNPMMMMQGPMRGAGTAGRGGRGGRGGRLPMDPMTIKAGRGGPVQAQWMAAAQQQAAARPGVRPGMGAPNGMGAMGGPMGGALPGAAPTAPSAVVPGQEQGGHLTTAMLAAAAPEQQKQMLGERLYPLVHMQQPSLAGKITGMLLEMDNSELLLLLEDAAALTDKVDEAVSVLKQHAPDAIPGAE